MVNGRPLRPGRPAGVLPAQLPDAPATVSRWRFRCSKVLTSDGLGGLGSRLVRGGSLGEPDRLLRGRIGSEDGAVRERFGAGEVSVCMHLGSGSNFARVSLPVSHGRRKSA